MLPDMKRVTTELFSHYSMPQKVPTLLHTFYLLLIVLQVFECPQNKLVRVITYVTATVGNNSFTLFSPPNSWSHDKEKRVSKKNQNPPFSSILFNNVIVYIVYVYIFTPIFCYSLRKTFLKEQDVTVMTIRSTTMPSTKFCLAQLNGIVILKTQHCWV